MAATGSVTKTISGSMYIWYFLQFIPDVEYYSCLGSSLVLLGCLGGRKGFPDEEIHVQVR